MTRIREGDKREQMGKGQRGKESDGWRREAEERGKLDQPVLLEGYI